MTERAHSLRALGADTQGEAAKEQWMRESIGYHSAKHLNEDPIPKVRLCLRFSSSARVRVEMGPPSAHV